MDNCYICNGVIDYKSGEWSAVIIENEAYKKCNICTNEKKFVMVLKIDVKDIQAFRKVISGFNYVNYLRNNFVNIVYDNSNYYLLSNLLNDIGFSEIEDEFIITNQDIYKRVINSFK